MLLMWLEGENRCRRSLRIPQNGSDVTRYFLCAKLCLPEVLCLAFAWISGLLWHVPQMSRTGVKAPRQEIEGQPKIYFVWKDVDELEYALVPIGI